MNRGEVKSMAKELLENGISLEDFRNLFLSKIRNAVDSMVAKNGEKIGFDYDPDQDMRHQPSPFPTHGGILDIDFDQDPDEPSWKHTFVSHDQDGYYLHKEFCVCGQYLDDELHNIEDFPTLKLMAEIPDMARSVVQDMVLRPQKLMMNDTGYSGVLTGTVRGIPHFQVMTGMDYLRYHNTPKEQRLSFLERLAMEDGYFGKFLHPEEQTSQGLHR